MDTTTMDMTDMGFGLKKPKKLMRKTVFISCTSCPGLYVKKVVNRGSKFWNRMSNEHDFVFIARVQGKSFYKKKTANGRKRRNTLGFGCGAPLSSSTHRFGGKEPSLNSFSGPARFGNKSPNLVDFSSTYTSTIAATPVPKPVKFGERYGKSRFGCGCNRSSFGSGRRSSYAFGALPPYGSRF